MRRPSPGRGSHETAFESPFGGPRHRRRVGGTLTIWLTIVEGEPLGRARRQSARSAVTMVKEMVKRGADPLDATFGALADPTRRAIVERLSRGEASVGELAEPFD